MTKGAASECIRTSSWGLCFFDPAMFFVECPGLSAIDSPPPVIDILINLSEYTTEHLEKNHNANVATIGQYVITTTVLGRAVGLTCGRFGKKPTKGVRGWSNAHHQQPWPQQTKGRILEMLFLRIITYKEQFNQNLPWPISALRGCTFHTIISCMTYRSMPRSPVTQASLKRQTCMISLYKWGPMWFPSKTFYDWWGFEDMWVWLELVVAIYTIKRPCG